MHMYMYMYVCVYIYITSPTTSYGITQMMLVIAIGLPIHRGQVDIKNEDDVIYFGCLARASGAWPGFCRFFWNLG